MSTKIYDAWRIPKDMNILEILKEGKSIFTQIVANDAELLYMIHGRTTYEASVEFEKNPKNIIAKSVIEDNDSNNIDAFWIETCLEKYGRSMEKEVVDITANCSVFYDDDFWYIKFFNNSNWMYPAMKEFVSKFEMEDFHYQDQVDPPEDIPENEFYSRIEVWDKLLGEEGNYRNAFSYTLFDAIEFRKLLGRNYYKGFKTNEELYSHLAYKFNKILEKNES